MKPAWDELKDAYEAESSVLIAEVDCTVEKSLCNDHGIEGFPTIKSYTQDDVALPNKAFRPGELYVGIEGGRDLASLKAHVKTQLVQCSCGPVNPIIKRCINFCMTSDRLLVDTLSGAEIDAKIKEGDETIAKAEASFNEAKDQLERQLADLKKTYDDVATEVEKSTGVGLPMLKRIREARVKDGADESDL
jgi:hypothetical protein